MPPKRDKRDRLAEIAEIKERSGNPNKLVYGFRINDLKQNFTLVKTNTELLRYFSLALVALNIEVFVRKSIEHIIDHGGIFLGRVENLPSAHKIDYTLINAIHGRKVTVGELNDPLILNDSESFGDHTGLL
jgi:hypothetical protein